MIDLRIDEKGKYFTPRVSKDVLPAFIRTNDQIIVGNIYARPDHRLKDELSGDDSRFLAITDVRVYAAADERLLYHSAIMLIAYQHIIMLCPMEAHENIRNASWIHSAQSDETA